MLFKVVFSGKDTLRRAATVAVGCIAAVRDVGFLGVYFVAVHAFLCAIFVLSFRGAHPFLEN